MKYLFRTVNGKLETELFEDKEEPKGWVDSPDKANPKSKAKAKAKAK